MRKLLYIHESAELRVHERVREQGIKINNNHHICSPERRVFRLGQTYRLSLTTSFIYSQKKITMAKKGLHVPTFFVFRFFFSKSVKREKLYIFCHVCLFSRKVSVIDMIVPINNIIVKVMNQGSLQRFGSCKHKIKCIVTFLMYQK